MNKKTIIISTVLAFLLISGIGLALIGGNKNTLSDKVNEVVVEDVTKKVINEEVKVKTEETLVVCTEENKNNTVSDVVVKEAWTETKPKYETKERSICNGCGKDITGKPWDHIEEQMLAGNTACGGYHSEWRQVQVGTETINHPAVTERKWVVDKPAWTEKVVTGHKCSGCGATK